MLKVKGHNVSIFIMLMSNLYSVCAYTNYMLSVSFFLEDYTHFITNICPVL